MSILIAILGFGEAAQSFSGSPGWRGSTRAFDKKTEVADARAGKLSDFARLGLVPCESAGEALASADLALSLVTADQALMAAEAASRHIRPSTLYLDMNSVAPARKQDAARLIEAAGGHYIDVAIMAPVLPAALDVPLLVSGPFAREAATALSNLGFSDIRITGEAVGQASAIKMIRSVMIKGVEALTAECLIAADAAGVTQEVSASFGGDWQDRADYNLERMLVHGARRAAEMEEVCATLESLGVEPLLTSGTVIRQRAIGAIGQGRAPSTLDAKLGFIRNYRKPDAA